jgi:hypothetical protein
VELFMSVSVSDKDLGQSNFFQVVGVISGEIQIEKNDASIKIANNIYKLCFRRNGVFQQLKKELEESEDCVKRLIVYPIFTHFPGKDKHKINFDVIGFNGAKKENNKNDLHEKLNNLEFKICGIWQYIPVCRSACISVFRNETEKLVAELKKSSPLEKAKIIKANHVPVNSYSRSLPKAYRFIKPVEGENANAYNPVFVSIKAEFDLSTDEFNFVELLCNPSNKSPRYLKLTKEEKIAAAKARLNRVREASVKVSVATKSTPPIKLKSKNVSPVATPQKPILKKTMSFKIC